MRTLYLYAVSSVVLVIVGALYLLSRQTNRNESIYGSESSPANGSNPITSWLTNGGAMTNQSQWAFSSRSASRLSTVHNDMQRVANRALELSPFDFGITSGHRTAEEQNALFQQNAPGNWVTDKDGYVRKSRHQTGKAIDIAVYNADGDLTWGWSYYEQVAWAFKQAADELEIPIVWGGDWANRDGAHFELSQ